MSLACEARRGAPPRESRPCERESAATRVAAGRTTRTTRTTAKDGRSRRCAAALRAPKMRWQHSTSFTSWVDASLDFYTSPPSPTSRPSRVSHFDICRICAMHNSSTNFEYIFDRSERCSPGLSSCRLQLTRAYVCDLYNVHREKENRFIILMFLLTFLPVIDHQIIVLRIISTIVVIFELWISLIKYFTVTLMCIRINNYFQWLW